MGRSRSRSRRRVFSLRSLAALTLLAGASRAAFAQTPSTWANIGQTWSEATHWHPAALPGALDAAQFHTLGTFSTNTTADALANPILDTNQTLQQLLFSSTATGSGWSLTGSASLTVTGNAATNPPLRGLTVRGLGVTTIDLGNGSTPSLMLGGGNGSTLYGSLDIGSGATLRLTGNTVANLGDSAISLRGGTLLLDNAAGNPAGQRLTLSGSGAAINLAGGGSTLEFRAATAGTTFSGTSTTTLRLGSGDARIIANQTGDGPLLVQLGDIHRASTAGFLTFMNVGTGTLGGSGPNDPRIRFTTAPSGSTLANGVITNSSTTPGFALYNGTDFAGYNATTGVIAAPSTAMTGTLPNQASTNAAIAGNATVTGSTISLFTVKLSPTAAGQSLLINSTLNSSAILLPGDTDYAITGTGKISGPSSRYVYVTNANTSLFTSAVFTGQNSLTKGGDGFLVFNGNGTNQFDNRGQSLQLSGGTLRAAPTMLDLTSTNGARLKFRGGVLEFDLSEGDASFTQPLGTANATVNWAQAAGPTLDLGGGGFSAYSTNPAPSTLTVNLFGNAATLTWGSQTGTDIHFVQDGYALTFGSLQSRGTVAWLNPIALDGGTPGIYQAREVQVTRGSVTPQDRTRLEGAITGSATTDLLKTGTGTLELAAANSYAGNTHVAGGRLLINGTHTGGSNIFVQAGGTLGGSGTIAPAPNASLFLFDGGTLAPGDPLANHGLGTLTLETDAIFKDGSHWAWDLNSATPLNAAGNSGLSSVVGQQDMLAILGGSHTLFAGNLTFHIREITAATLDSGLGYSFQVAGTAGTPTLQNVTFDLGTAPSFARYVNDGGTLSLDVAGGNVYLNLTAVPEPSAVLLVAAGGLACFWHRRRSQDISPTLPVK